MLRVCHPPSFVSAPRARQPVECLSCCCPETRPPFQDADEFWGPSCTSPPADHQDLLPWQMCSHMTLPFSAEALMMVHPLLFPYSQATGYFISPIQLLALSFLLNPCLMPLECPFLKFPCTLNFTKCPFILLSCRACPLRTLLPL